MSNPYRPAASESYEDQLSNEPFRGEEDELPSPKANFLNVSQHHHHEQEGGLIGSSKLMAKPTPSSAPSSLVDNLPGAGAAKSGLTAMLSFLSVDYYRPYFDVSTRAVGQRIKNALDPRSTDVFALPVYEPVAAPPPTEGGDAESQTPSAMPPSIVPVAEFDLFGSVWISLTLVFLIGATSNLNAYLASSKPEEMTSTDYTLLTFASTMVVSYTSVFATLLWLAAGWLGATKQPALFKLLGLYGYVLSWFVIASIVCIIPVSAVQWIAVIVAGSLSGLVLARNLVEMFAFDVAETTGEGSAKLPASKQKMLLGVALAAHLVFTLLLKLYFFQGAQIKV
ncbi:hypothetical protein BASA81_008013 [Batrachochytrium salamandrivorans]|nr:hypothetical protein BASA81_008013 [Batrachochytrium salamandrivorans]